jgi:molecular chaperone DnaJ
VEADPGEEVRRVARAVAAAIAPGLEQRLVQVYGYHWLAPVNEHREQAGVPTVPRHQNLTDHRFCLAVFGHDPATVGWAHESLRRNARQLGGLASAAAHDRRLTVADVARARQLAQPLHGWADNQPYAANRPSWPRGRDVEATIRLPFVEAIRGGVVPLTLRVPDPCEVCQGSGRRAGVLFNRRCPMCQGAGERPQERSLNVRFPAGIADGNRIRLSGRGQPGPADGAAGDLYVWVQVERDVRFERQGDTLVHVASVSPEQARRGVEISVPTLDGYLTVRVPAGVPPGRVLRIRGKGVPRPDGTAGDLLVNINVRNP